MAALPKVERALL